MGCAMLKNLTRQRNTGRRNSGQPGIHELSRRRIGSLLAALALLSAARPASASVLTDFQARLAQATWCLSQTEILVRAQAVSATPVATPEGIISWMALVAENVAGLVQTSGGAATDEQKKLVAAGLKGTAATLQDLSSLAQNRGLQAVALAFDAHGSSCQAALRRL